MTARRILASLFLLTALAGHAAAQSPYPPGSPPAVGSLPDSERRTSYSITGTNCACSVGFQLYASGSDVDAWIQVWVNGARYLSTDPTFGWSLSSATGNFATIPRPITDAVLTFNNAQTGTVVIVGAERPRQTQQFQEGAGVPARALNQRLTELSAIERELWDKTNDVTGRALLSPPGNVLGTMPAPTACASGFLGFDATGTKPICIGNTSTIGGLGPTPSPSIYGVATIQSGLIPTWPTAAVTGYTINSSGNSFTSNPTAQFLGGLTNGGTGGGSITCTESAGAVNACSISNGGNFSFPPVIYISGGGGSGAQVASVLGNTTSLTTSAGVILVNGAAISVPAYTHTYATSSNTILAYCDFISTTTGAYLTQAATFGSGNFGCTMPPAGYVTLRAVWSQNGQVGSAGTLNGVEQIQYFMPMTAGFGWFGATTKDAPPQSTESPGGNAFPTGLNFPCMMGAYGSQQGGCQFNTQYMSLVSPNTDPIAYSNILDGGPIWDFQRNTTGRVGLAGDLLGVLLFKGVDANKNLTQFAQFQTLITNPGTVGNSYTDSAGAIDLYTKGADGGAPIPRFRLGGGLFPPTFGGQECGQFPAPAGGVALVDKGPSTINMCGNISNNLGNGGGYYLDNLIVLQTHGLTLYGSVTGQTIVVPQATASGTLTLPGATDTLVGKATTDTLTNKSIDSSEINSGTLPAARLGGLGNVVAALGSDTSLNNTGNYFDGPSAAQGTSGTWLAFGQVTVVDTAGPAQINCKLWDGTTLIAAGSANTSGANNLENISISGILASPAGNIRISCNDATSTSGKIVHAQGAGNSAVLNVARIN